MSVVIPTSEGPYGALGVHTRRRRTFTEDEVNFLQSVANVFGSAIERERAEAQLLRHQPNPTRPQQMQRGADSVDRRIDAPSANL